MGIGKANTRVLSAAFGFAVAAAAPAVATGAAGVACQIGGAVLCEASAGFLGYTLALSAFPNANGSDPVCGTDGVNGAALFMGISLFAAYPLAATAGTYFVGEKVGGPAGNKGATFGMTTFAAYYQTLLLVGTAAAVRALDDDVGGEAYMWALALDAATKPAVTTFFYHKAKRPARDAAESRLAVKPSVCMAAGEGGKPLPLYGVSLYF
jgi:hypothetical protein